MKVKLNVLIPDEINKELIKLCKKKERSKGYIIRKALQSYFEDQEDYEDAIATLLSSNGETIPFEKIEKENGLED